MVKEDGSFNKQPKISMPNKDLIKVTIQSGTVLSTQWGFYYNIEADEFSQIFYSIYAEYDEKVAYRDGSAIIVRNIFNASDYYREISAFQYSLSETTGPFSSVDFLNYSNSIKISYLTGDNYQVVTEIFNLALSKIMLGNL
ncbi:MAG: hypothetical protein LUD57_03710 [Ruminococcus sp.]|nr:hypothetical protein [Ruminococcus sp.]